MKRFLLGLLVVSLAFPTIALAGPKNKKNPKRGPEAAFKKLDSNNDGKLSKDELTARGKGKVTDKRFQRADKNNDGSISLDEFKSRGEKKGKKAKQA